MPTLSIIAGPNGAGKSTYSKQLVSKFSIEAFDFDREFDLCWSRFSYDPFVKQGIHDATHELFIARREAALFTRSDFAFETNYHTEAVFATLEAFKENGYRLELQYIFLENINHCIQRVKQRSLEGGLLVSENTIRARFSAGLQLLDTSFMRFDLVSLFSSSEESPKGIADIEPHVQKVTMFNQIPSALVPLVPTLYKFINQNLPSVK